MPRLANRGRLGPRGDARIGARMMLRDVGWGREDGEDLDLVGGSEDSRCLLRRWGSRGLCPGFFRKFTPRSSSS